VVCANWDQSFVDISTGLKHIIVVKFWGGLS
jgi:hypothetical protein